MCKGLFWLNSRCWCTFATELEGFHWKGNAILLLKKAEIRLADLFSLKSQGLISFVYQIRFFAWTLPIDLMLLASRGNGLPGYLPAVLGELNLFVEGSHKRQVAGEPCGEYLSQKELIWSLLLQWWWTIKYLSSAIFLFLLFCFFLMPLWDNSALQVEHWQWQFSERNHLVQVSRAVYPMQVRDRKQAAE